jgi:macrolide-specific efflux system membrane fusion protein
VKIGKTIVVLALLGAVGGGGWWWWHRHQKRDDLPTYDPITVQRGDIVVNIQATASVTPENRVEIKPPVGGRMEELLVAEGDAVKEGQIIAWMSSTDRAALVDSARARGPQELARWREIYKATPIVAPLEGSIILRNVEPGQTVTMSDAVLVLSDHLIVEAQVDETDLAQIHLGQPVQINLDAYPDKTMEGTVSHIKYESKIFYNVTTYTVEIRFKQIPAFVRSGMTAITRFFIAAHTNTLFILNDAVRYEKGRMFVDVPSGGDEDQPPATREIKIGLNDGKRVEVVSGLVENETVLIRQAYDTATNQPSNPFMAKFPSRSRGGR